MKYDGDIAYNQAHFNYNGVYVVSPESFGLTSNFGGLNVLSVIVISPPSINSTLVFVDTHNIIGSTGIIENSETSSSISFSMFDGYGSLEMNKINADAFALASVDNQELYSAGVLALSVNKNDAYAISNAESIILENNSAGTVNVTIISNA
jgi:hypothetical protein